MKIQSIYVQNFLGTRLVDVQTTAPIQLFAGANGAGKSSVRDAIALALTADLGRVSLKKEAGRLIHSDSGTATADVRTADGDAYTVTINSAGKITDSRSGKDINPTMAYVLDAQRFARLEPKERQSFLFGAMNLKTDGPAIVQRLLDKGHDKHRVDRIAPMLRSGFDAAHKDAKVKGSEAKGAWQQVTGEAYGSEKAKTWRANVPAQASDAAAKAKELATEVQHCDVAMANWNQKIGALQAEAKRRDELRARLPALQEHAGRIQRIERKLATDEQELANIDKDLDKAKAAAAGQQAPRIGLVHELAWAVNNLVMFGDALDPKSPEDARIMAAVSAYEAEYGSINGGAKASASNQEALASLPALTSAHELMARSVANGGRDLAAAKRANDELDTITTELATPFDAAELTEARAQVQALTETRAAKVKQLDSLKAIKAQAESAERKTEDAAKHHADVAAWEAIAKALAPNGIPGEILSAALDPLNNRLGQSATDAQWASVVVQADMSIESAGRPYAMLSESEKWRTDAMLAEAISFLSGCHLLVLDRFDVLDLTGRADLIEWLDILAQDGEIDSAFIFGTLKALPSTLPSTIDAHWIDHGVVSQLKEAA